MIWQFLFGIVLYLFGLTGLDRMVTGVLAEGLEPKGQFQAYALWHTLMNQAVAFMVSNMYWNCSPNPSFFVSVLIYLTVVWCWVGGSLDFLYFMMKGEIPEWSKIWNWMPFKPKTWQVGVYAFICLFLVIVSWSWVIFSGLGF